MPRPALRLVPTLLAVASAGPALVAADIYVSAGAAAGGTGTFAAPYRTIAAGLAVAQAGDTVWLRAGEYRETIDFPRSGAPGAPITLAAYAPGGDPARRERVVVHRATIWTPGSGGFGTWQDLGGGRWSILLPSSVVSGAKAGQFIVTLGTQVLQDARWPNTDVIPDITQRQAAWSTAGAILDQDVGGDTKRDVGRYTVPGIDGFPTDALAGAQIQINPNKQWGTRQAKVTANAGQDITFEFSRATTAGTAYGHNGDPFSRDPVIVWDTPVVLDRDDEFWIDLAGRIGPANTLYVQRSTPPTGLAFGIERPGAAPLIKISNRSHLVLRGFETVGGATGTTSTTTAAIRFESMTFRLSSPGLGGGGHLSLSGDGHAVVDCEFIDSHGPAITFGYGNQVSTNVTIEECRFSMVKDALSSGGTVAWPDNLVFRHNTVSDIAGSGISFNAVDSDFGYNHVYRAGLNSADISLINAVGSPPQGPLHTRVHHNWAYAPRAAKDGRSQRWLGCNGIRTDSGFDDTGGIAGVTIDRNVVWGDGLNTGIQIFTNLPGKWGGGGAKGDSVDVIVAHNTVAASGYIQGCINLVGRSNAKGIEIVNNIASAYTIDTSIRSGASAPTLVASNLFTAGASNLPTDNDTRVTGRNLERIDPRFEDSVKRDFRLAAGSPAIDAGVVHATSGTYAGSAPDIGAYERGEALWIAGARVQPRHVPALEVRPVVDPDGTRWAVVDNLPKGRLLPVGTRLRIGSVEFADGTWSYDPAEDRGRLWFAVGAQEFADGTAAAVDLGGTGTWTALDAPVGGLMRRVAGMTWNDAAQTMEVLGGGLYGSAWTLTPVALDRPSMGDLRQRPVYGAVDLAGRDPDRFDLVAVTTGQAIPLNHSQDRIAGGLRYGWAVLPDRQSDVFGPATGVRLYATERTGGGPRTHSAPSLSGALPDGRPEEVSFSALTNPFLLAHFRPEDAVTVGASVSAWTDRIGGYTASAATLTARPERVDGLLSGLPGIRFDGTSDGLAFRSGQADGQFMAAAVHRNAGDGLAPGSAGYQRLVATAGSGTAAFGLSDTTSTGAAVARAAPWAVASTANAIFGRDEIRIGANGSTRYAGVIGEIMLFSSLASDDDPWAPNGWGNDKAARDYLQTKYRNGPAGRIGTGSGAGIPAATLRFAGVDLELVSVEGGRMVFALPASAARIAPYGGAVLGLPGAATQAAAVTVTGDATAPARPAAPAVAGNGTPRPTVTGVTEPFATVRIRDNGILVGTVTADAQGQWTWTPASDLAAGIHQITAEAVDGSGNASAASPATRVEVSAAPVIAVPAAVEPDLVLP